MESLRVVLVAHVTRRMTSIVMALTLTAVMFFGGCAPIPARLDPFAVSEPTDRFHPEVRHIESGKLRVWGTNNWVDFVSIRQNYSYDSSIQKGSQIYWSVLYFGFDWVFIRDMEILVEGQVMHFEPSRQPQTDVGRSGCVSEILIFEIPDFFYLTANSAPSMAIRFNGEKRTLESDLPKEAIEHFRLFFDSVLQKRKAWKVPNGG